MEAFMKNYFFLVLLLFYSTVSLADPPSTSIPITIPTTTAYSPTAFYAIDVEYFDSASRNYFDDPNEAEGSPDGNYVALGGGYIIATMEKWFKNGTGADILVYEIGSTIDSGETDEPFDFHISSDKVNWIKVADNIINDSGKPYASIDITGKNGSYKFVKVTDRVSGLGYGLSPGSDIDAIGAKYEGEETTPTTTDCWLYIDVLPPKGGTTSPAPDSIFSQGCSPITVEAIPNLLYAFSHWEGDIQGSDNPITIEFGFEPSKSIIAVFVLDICPIEILYGEHSEQTELLRYFRDNILSQTPEGQEIIKLYYQWSPIIVRAIDEDEAFKEEVKAMIDGVLLLVRGK